LPVCAELLIFCGKSVIHHTQAPETQSWLGSLR
jgi:hypothetical protein